MAKERVDNINRKRNRHKHSTASYIEKMVKLKMNPKGLKRPDKPRYRIGYTILWHIKKREWVYRKDERVDDLITGGGYKY